MDDNIHNLRDALGWLDRRIREEAEYDGEMSNEHAIQLGFITNMLEKFPLRQCDVGSPEEQEKRWHKNCGHGIPNCKHCKVYGQAKESGFVSGRGFLLSCSCKFVWAQMPYEAEEGAGE